MTAEKLYEEFITKYDSYNPHRQAAFKARLTRLAKRTSPDDHSARSYMDIMAAQLDRELQYGEPKPKSFMLPIYKVQLVRDSSQVSDRKKIRSPIDAADILNSYLAHADREHFVAVMLDSKNQIIGINTVSIGTLDSALVSPREVFKPAMLCNAAAIILAHNHPSGDPTPSPEDVNISKQLVQAGQILDIEVLDSLIIGEGRHVSLKEGGLL